jgi:hypothetical protein
MTPKLMAAIFFITFALVSILYQAFSHSLGMIALSLAITAMVAGMTLLFKTAEEQIPND